MSNLYRVKDLVEKFLQEDERCRNDDNWLTFKFIQHYKGSGPLTFQVWESLPSFASITRCRRLFQNKHNMYLPTDPEVMRQRGIRQSEIIHFVKFN